MSKKGKKEKFTYNKKSITSSILGIFRHSPQKAFNYKQLASLLNIKDESTRQLITTVLIELRDTDTLEEVYTGKFKIKSKGGFITGIVEMNSKGFGFIRSEDLSEEIFVSQRNLNHALHGDEVKVYLFAKKKSAAMEGEVVHIIKRARETFVGTVEISGAFAFLVPDHRHMPYDIFIPLQHLNGAEDGQKAVAKMTDWPDKAKNPFGTIIEVLGDSGDNETEIHAIMAEFELPMNFDADVLREAELIPEEITEKEIKTRKDFRNITTFTIDPEDAKDFDDALSVEFLDNGKFRIGVHIADVTHYVEEGSILDNEAYARATSVYLVDRVVPMLPERLSNYICSLRPKEDKLCFSAVFVLDENAAVEETWFGKTIINSDRRFAYAEAQSVIDTGEGDMVQELLTVNKLATKLRAMRFKKGALGFERTEVKFTLDEKGKPLGVFFKEATDANHLIEEFMLLANRSVAEYAGSSGDSKRTFVYRVHDLPDPEKLEQFSNFIRRFGYGKLNTGSGNAIASSMNALLEQVSGKKEQDVIETLAIKAMAKAEYSTKNIGHYGLAFNNYSHFTSPIRRYPDMMAHRLLFHYLNKGESLSSKHFEKKCKHSSDMEHKAAMAERASVKFKQVEFMSDKIGEVFSGVISGLTEWGIYVEIVENKCEGMVPLRTLTDDYYQFDEDNYIIMGRRTKRKFQLGDEVEVEIIAANIQKKQLDLCFVDA